MIHRLKAGDLLGPDLSGRVSGPDPQKHFMMTFVLRGLVMTDEENRLFDMEEKREEREKQVNITGIENSLERIRKL